MQEERINNSFVSHPEHVCLCAYVKEVTADSRMGKGVGTVIFPFRAREHVHASLSFAKKKKRTEDAAVAVKGKATTMITAALEEGQQG